MTPSLIEPREIPAEVRLEPGMILARLERATHNRPERRKVIVLVRAKTVQKPKSAFAPDPWAELKDVTEWSYVRLLGSTEAPDVSPMMGPGSLGAVRDSAARRMFRFIGFIGDVRGGIDWDSFQK